MRAVYVTLVVLIVCPSVHPCTSEPRSELVPDTEHSLFRFIDEQFGLVDSQGRVRELVASGYGDSVGAHILFQPHKVDAGIEISFRLFCDTRPSVGWKCNELTETYSISVEDPDDVIHTEKDLGFDTARQIVATVREAIMVDESGRFKFNWFNEESISEGPLDLFNVQSLENGSYYVFANTGSGCVIHRITVRESKCDGGHCEFEITRNDRQPVN